jgi:anti-anti-sigma regulatory factor
MRARRAGTQLNLDTRIAGPMSAPSPTRAVQRQLPNVPSIVRQGERGCCRAVVHPDSHRLVRSFVRDALRRGDRVIYLCGDQRVGPSMLASARQDDELRAAIGGGTLAVLDARRWRAVASSGAELVARVQDEHQRALDDGLTGLSVTGDICAAVPRAGKNDVTVEYKRALDELHRADLGVLSLFDHRRFPAATLSMLAAAHDVDVSPALVAIGGIGSLAAGWVCADRALRLVGELDVASAGDLSAMLAAHFHGPLRLDLADLSFVDVVGMYALRGRVGQRLTIIAASDQVRRVIELLGWDSDPDIELAPAIA